MIAFLASLALKAGIPARFAKFAVIAALVMLLIVGLGVAKCTYDRSVINAHDAKRDAATAKADRKADEHAAVQRRTDDARLATETQEVKDAVEEAKRTGADPRAAYYACVRLQQSARARLQPPPDC
ncbi:MAG: hypothetical protein ACR652_17820 [Methylocystis sp.]|uniref:hypothetical protein n=1 Tax=Methylocystis sp. TaxID=1911079 RepID=UPI003DA53FD2